MLITQRTLVTLAAGALLLTACGEQADSDGATHSADTVSGGADTTAQADTAAPVDTTPARTACTTDSDCVSAPEGPLCDTAVSGCAALPMGHQIGWRDGSAESVDAVELVAWSRPFEATDLEFHPTRNELWVVNRVFEEPGLCTESNLSGARCASLAGFVSILFDVGTPQQRVEIHEDGNAWHFMRRPPAMAMGANETWATCGEASTGNFEDGASQFIGPSLWSSDLTVFGPGPPHLNGSHLDMLHATPQCMGIAHERDNVYWTFNGDKGAIDRYDFGVDHGPGNDDHSDGIIHRYVEGMVSRVPGVPSHMEFNPDDGHLYIADTGNARVVKLDTTSGTRGAPFIPVYEVLADYGKMENATLTEVVPPGLMTQPSAMVLHDDLLFVADAATSVIYAFQLDGTIVNRTDVGLPPHTIGGMTIGRDDKLYFTSMKTGVVYRLDPK